MGGVCDKGRGEKRSAMIIILLWLMLVQKKGVARVAWVLLTKTPTPSSGSSDYTLSMMRFPKQFISTLASITQAQNSPPPRLFFISIFCFHIPFFVSRFHFHILFCVLIKHSHPIIASYSSILLTAMYGRVNDYDACVCMWRSILHGILHSSIIIMTKGSQCLLSRDDSSLFT